MASRGYARNPALSGQIPKTKAVQATESTGTARGKSSRAALRGLSYKEQVQMLSPGNAITPVQMDGVDTKTEDSAAQDTAGTVTGDTVKLLFKNIRGAATQEENDALADRIFEMSDEEFEILMNNRGMANAIFFIVGDVNADKIADTMKVEFEIPMFMFHNVKVSMVEHQIEVANHIFGRYGMRIIANPITHISREEGRKYLAGNPNVIRHSDMKRVGRQTQGLISLHPGGGKTACFWFPEIYETDDTYVLNGRALAAWAQEEFKGKEAVVVWDEANPETLAHELGHIFAGKQTDHRYQSDHGSEHLMSEGNLGTRMHRTKLPGSDQELLTRAEIRAFKSSLYAKVKRG